MKTFLKKAVCALCPGWVLLPTRFRNGVVVKGENRPGHGGRGLFLFGEALEEELDVLEQFLPESGVLIDVGANVGAFSLKAAKSVGPKGLVVSVEPFPRMADRLQRNCMENELDNVRIRVCCASDTVGFAQFWLIRDTPNAFSLIEHPGARSFNTLTVTIDWLAENEKLERLDYLKIDAEGAEDMILNGARSTIERHRPLIQVEINKKKPEAIPGDYRVWQSPPKVNQLLIPRESPYNETAKALGWTEVA